MKRRAMLKKLILESLLSVRGQTMKRAQLIALVNFDADPPATETEFDGVLQELEKDKRLSLVRNDDTGELRAGITANGVAALAEM